MFGLFESKIAGGDVYINNGIHDADFRVRRAQGRVHSLTRKLNRLKKRVKSAEQRLEINNTEVAIAAWQDALELASLELELQNKRGNKS